MDRNWGQVTSIAEGGVRNAAVTTINQFCVVYGIDRFNILKLDVQVAEYAVLEGATELLVCSRIGLIYIELILCPTYEGQMQLHDYLLFSIDMISICLTCLTLSAVRGG